jgi:hypothetical protein
MAMYSRTTTTKTYYFEKTNTFEEKALFYAPCTRVQLLDLCRSYTFTSLGCDTDTRAPLS